MRRRSARTFYLGTQDVQLLSEAASPQTKARQKHIASTGGTPSGTWNVVEFCIETDRLGSVAAPSGNLSVISCESSSTLSATIERARHSDIRHCVASSTFIAAISFHRMVAISCYHRTVEITVACQPVNQVDFESLLMHTFSSNLGEKVESLSRGHSLAHMSKDGTGASSKRRKKQKSKTSHSPKTGAKVPKAQSRSSGAPATSALTSTKTLRFKAETDAVARHFAQALATVSALPSKLFIHHIND